MSLKRQLFLLGLLTLILPWLALRYMGQVDHTLRQMRLSNLQELTENTRRLLLQNPVLIQRLQVRNQALPATFAPPAVADRLVDGYLTEWPAFNGQCALTVCQAQRFVALPAGVQAQWLSAKGADDTLYLAFRLSGFSPVLYQPQAASDAVILRFDDEQFKLQAARSGGGFVQRKTTAQGRWQRDYASEAFWRIDDSSGAITIEWQLPARLQNKAFSLSFASAQLGYALFASVNNQPMHWAFYEHAYVSHIAPLLGPEQRLMLFDARGYPFVEVGALALGYGLPSLGVGHSWLMRWYVYFFNKPAQPYHKPSVPMLAEQKEQQWLFNRIAPIARVTIPLGLDAHNRPLGWLIMDRQESRFDSLLAQVYSEFVLLCVAFAIVVVLVLVGFASLHSWRIRRLAASARRTLGEQGELSMHLIAQNFKASKSPDEIGQLSRSLSVLLMRLSRQQAYLRNLAAKLSHELRTPIAVIQSSLDNLCAQGLDDGQAQYVKRAGEGAKRLSRTLNAMSAANALEQSLEAVECERVDMRALLGDIVAAYQEVYAPQMIVAHISDEVSTAQSGPWPLEGAPELLVQMFDKLIENACQFAADKTPIHFECTRIFDAHQGGECIRVSIRNIGPALPKGMEQQVFDSMVSVRAPTPSTHASESHSESEAVKPLHLGLGLYVARLICAFHQGSIRAFSEPYAQSENSDAPQSSHRLVTVTFEVLLPIKQ